MVHRLVVVGALCVNVRVCSSDWVIRGLAVVLLFLLVVFCGGQRFPFGRIAWSLGGLGFLRCWRSSFGRECWGLVVDESLGLVVSGVISGESLGCVFELHLGVRYR